MDEAEKKQKLASGWLRPGIFGAMDGLVSNFALIMGVAGGTAAATDSTTGIVLAGLAGLAAGAFSMAAGEYTSVKTQAEYEFAVIEAERKDVTSEPEKERVQLAGFFVKLGAEEADALKVSEQIHRDTNLAVRAHALHEFGLDLEKPPSAMLAAVASFLSFTVGAIIPLIPYLVGAKSPWPAIIVSVIGLFASGAAVTAMTGRNWFYGGTRQLIFGLVAAGATYGIGMFVGGTIL